MFVEMRISVNFAIRRVWKCEAVDLEEAANMQLRE